MTEMQGGFLSIQDWPWLIIATSLVGAVVLVSAWVQIGKPWWRERKSRAPCKVHFVIHAESEARQPYVVQDDDRHFVRTLSLPPHATFEVEIGYVALLPFKLLELVIGCDGEYESRPYVAAISDRHASAAVADGKQALDARKHFHWKREVLRSVGTHYVVTAKLNTLAPGTYLFLLSFITGEIEGKAALSIVVERSPRTRAKCLRHRDCHVRPRRQMQIRQ